MSKAIQIDRISDKDHKRYSSGIDGFDQLLGQDPTTGERGFVPGEVVLFAGEPGSGKTTLFLQIANNMAQAGQKILYTTGEESLTQIKTRANRLRTLNSKVWCSDSINLEEFYQVASEVDPTLIVIDSLQMIYSSSHRGDPGSPSQMKAALKSLIQYAKDNDKILIIICHTTKSGIIAGAMTLQFLVDANFRMYVDQDSGVRTVFVEKNRFGLSKVDWRANMTPDGLLDVHEKKIVNTALRQAPILDQKAVDTVVLKYDQIKAVLDQSFVNRYAVNNDIKWLYEKIYGRIEAKLHKVNKFNITIEVEPI